MKSEVLKSLHEAREIARRELAVLIMTVEKLDAGIDAIEELNGSMTGAAPPARMTAEPEPPKHNGLVLPPGRKRMSPFQMDDDVLRLLRANQNAPGVRVPNIALALESKYRPKGRTQRDWDQTVCRHLSRMAIEGKIRRVSRGYYSVLRRSRGIQVEG